MLPHKLNATLCLNMIRMWANDPDSAPPPAYTPLPDEPPILPETNPPRASNMVGIDDHHRGLTIGHGSRLASSIETSSGIITDCDTVISPTSPSSTFRVPRYLYYQVFSPNGIIESKRSFSEDDPYTGRVIASHITLPHSAKLVKRYLCAQEEVLDAKHTDLLATITSDSELNDGDRIRVLAKDGPGSVADEPMALIIKDIPLIASPSTNIPTTKPLTPLIPFSPMASLFLGHSNSVFSVAFSPDGTQVASSSGDKSICVWDAASRKVITGPIVTNMRVYSVSWSPDGKQIVSGCYDRPYIRLWDARTGTEVSGLFEGHMERVISVAFSRDGWKIASGSGDKTIRIWHAVFGTLLVGPIMGHTDNVTSVAFSPDGTYIVSGSLDTTVCVWDTRTGQLVGTPFRAHLDSVRSVAFAPSGRWIISGSRDHSVRVWDAETVTGIASGPPIATRCLTGHSNWVWAIAVTPDGQWIVSGSWDGTVRIWSFEAGQTAATLIPVEGPLAKEHALLSIAISPNGDRIVAGSYSGAIYIWNRVSG